MRILVSFILFLFTAINLPAAPNVRTSPIPSWLHPIYPDLGKKPIQRDISDGYYYELLEEQTSLLNNTTYSHYIKHIINKTGVQDASEISVTFSPQFQQVVFHRITIMREGAVLNQLQPNEIKVVQEEKEASNYEYNGLKRAYLTLKDVRKGDRIEVAYSLVGFNPVFANKFSEEAYFINNTAVCNYYKTIITTPTRKLNIRYGNKATAPVTLSQGNTFVYFWDNPPLKSWQLESETPVWYDANPVAYISEYPDWQDVVGWGLATFNNYHYPLPASLQQKIAAWRSTAKGDKDLFANLATRFVQNDVRYLALEIGANTHRPHAPADVFTHRYGDCKDKALLLTTILQNEGIPAYVALVNTSTRSRLLDVAPSPAAFDHAITAIQRPGGEYIYVDPTNAGQRGELTSLYIPDYGYALLLKDGEKKLQPITPGRIYNYTIIETLDAPFYDTSHYTISSVYAGGIADEMRQAYEEKSVKDLEKYYLDYYAGVFNNVDGIQQDGAIVFQDDSLKNEFKVTKRYLIPAIWDTTEKDTKALHFAIKTLGQHLPDPSNAPADMPLSLTYPCNIHYTLNLTLPEGWDKTFSSLHIKNDAYQFDFMPDINGGNMTLYFTLRTFKDHIPASAVAKYKSDYKNMEGLLYFKLYKEVGNDEASSSASDNASDQDNLSAPSTNSTKACWPAIWLTFFFALIFSRIFIWLNRREAAIYYAPGSGYPLGGWLLLLGLSIIMSLGINVISFFGSNYYSYDNWTAYADAGGRSLQNLYLGKMAIQLVIIATTGATLFWFVKRRDIFPRMFMWHIAILLTGKLLIMLLFYLNPIPAILHPYKDAIIPGLIRTAAYSIIWGYYIWRSDQVRSTFLEPFYH
ncbi:MAG: DUF3857 domain-containing protein [Bacteroidetes bacterium]|nr:DUF3857 domain-containing protein [Bacteroidota bacterium]